MNAYPVHRLLNRQFHMPRLRVPAEWLDAALFAVKLPVAGVTVWLLAWMLMDGGVYSPTMDSNWMYLPNDSVLMANYWGGICLCAAIALFFGGLYQFFKHSRSAGAWSLGFALFALIIGVVLTYLTWGCPEWGTQVLVD
jgi:hypothetical protein